MTARHPAAERLVDAYLHDLDRSLAHLEVDERRDVVDSVREHIEVALEERGRTPSADDVEDVLRQLGSVEQIARDADAPGSTGPQAAARDRGDGDRERPAAAAQYLLAALIVGMAVTASLITVRIPPFFTPEGGDPVAVAQFTWAFLVFAVAAFIVKRNA